MRRCLAWRFLPRIPTTLTEVEFLNGFDALEARATAFFLDSAAYLRLDQGKGLHLVFSTDIDGPLAAGARAESLKAILPTVRAAFAEPGRILLGPPLQLETGHHGFHGRARYQ